MSADAERTPDGGPVKAKPDKPAPPTPEELAEYDAETARAVVAAETRVGSAEANYEMLKAEAAKPKADPELWRDYPIDRWTRFGVTVKDVEKMAAGEVKRESGRRPIVTVGNLSEFTQPTPSGYSRQYADIKGIGPGGADRISEAETKFWGWWGNGGEAEFAAERGVRLDGVANPAGPGSGTPEAPAGGEDADDGYPGPEYGEPVGVYDHTEGDPGQDGILAIPAGAV